jgi:multidrug resistance efflux pump
MLTIATLLLLAAPQDPSSAPSRGASEGKPQAGPETRPARRGFLTPAFELDAVLESAERFEAKLQFESYAGELVVRAAAAHGAAAKKDDVLLALETGPLERQLAAAENELRLARAQLEKAQADRDLGSRADALSLAQAERALADAKAEVKVFEEVEGARLLATADLSVKQSEDAVSDQTEELGQLEKMYKADDLSGATAEIVVRRARRSLERGRVYLQLARADADVVRTVRHPQQRRRVVDAAESAAHALESVKAAQALSRIQREVELARAQAAAGNAEDLVARLRRDLARLTVRAPFDGRVFHGQFQQGAWGTVDQVSPSLHAGERPAAGQVLLTLCGPVAAAAADVREADFFEILPGAAVEVAPEAAPHRKSAGKVHSLSAHAAARASGPAFAARVVLDAPRAELLQGMKAKVSLKGAELKDVVLVPSGAVSRAEGKTTVQVVKGGQTTTRTVLVGASDGDSTHVRSGLEAGEQVVVPK